MRNQSRPVGTRTDAFVSVICLVVTVCWGVAMAQHGNGPTATWQVDRSGEIPREQVVRGELGEQLVIHSAGRTFFHTPVKGDFQLQFRLTDIQGDDARAGIRVVESVEGGSSRSMGKVYRVGGRRSPSPDQPRWLRIIRKDGRFGVYHSWDGRRFMPVLGNRFEFDQATVYVGMVVEGGSKANPATAVIDQIQLTRPTLDYRTSWFGNTLPGPIENTFNFNVTGLYTAPDGTCFVTSFFEEQGHRIAAFRDGEQIAPDSKTPPAGMAAAANAEHVFASHKTGFLRLDRDLSGGQRFVSVADGAKGHKAVRGLAASDRELFVSNHHQGRIEVYNARSLEKLRQFQFQRPGPLAIGEDGGLWVIREGFEQTPFELWREGAYSHDPEIVKLDPQTGEVQVTISDLQLPTALAVDKQRRRLIVAENGPDQQARVYDISGKPKLVGTIGDKGGIYSGVAGEVRDDKFNGLTGVGVDAEGNIYVSSTGWPNLYVPAGLMANATSLRAFAPEAINADDPEADWKLQSLGYIFDGATLDPADKTVAHAGADQMYKLDWSKGPGEEGTFEAFTANINAFPLEYKGRRDRSAPLILRMEDERILALREQGDIFFYRFDRDGHGHTAIPAAAIGTQKGKKPQEWPANAPWEKRRPYVWVDGHGGGPIDGKAQSEEYRTHENLLRQSGTKIDVDANGDVWYTGWHSNRVVHLKFAGLQNGVPKWQQAPEVFEAPEPFDTLQFTRYDADADTMVLAGSTPMYPGVKDVRGRTTYVARYPRWSEGNRTSSVEFPLAMDPSEFYLDGGHGVVVVDHYLYTGGRPGNVKVYDLRHGNRVIEFWAGPEINGMAGYFDRDQSAVQAFHLPSTGEYVALCQENGWCKIVMYRWTPDESPAAAPEIAPRVTGTLGNGQVKLQWNTSHTGIIEGYQVYRGTSADGPFEKITDAVHPKPTYVDSTVTNGRRYFYRVSIVNAAGEGPQSDPVDSMPQQARAEFVGIDAETQGHWKGRYGRDGFYIVGDWTSPNNPTVPDYFQIDGRSFRRKAGHQPRPIEHERFLLKAAEGSTDRASFPPGSDYREKQQDYLLEFTDGRTHTLTLYAAGGHDYATRVRLIDASTGEVLDEREVVAESEEQGQYISWNVAGAVRLHYDKMKGRGFGNYLAGFFLDPVDARLPTENNRVNR